MYNICCVVLEAYSRHVNWLWCRTLVSLSLAFWHINLRSKLIVLTHVFCVNASFSYRFLVIIILHQSWDVVMTAAFQSSEQNCRRIKRELHNRCDWLKPTRTKSKKSVSKTCHDVYICRTWERGTCHIVYIYAVQQSFSM